MNNFENAHNKWLDPPDDPPVCEDGCGEVLKRDLHGDWYCDNKFCPNKFQGVEKEMAEMLIGANETVKSLMKELTAIRSGRHLVYGMRQD